MSVFRKVILSASGIELKRQILIREVLLAGQDYAGNFIFLESRSELRELDLKFSHFHIGHDRDQVDHEEAADSSSITQNCSNIGVEEAESEGNQRDTNVHKLESSLIHAIQGGSLFKK